MLSPRDDHGVESEGSPRVYTALGSVFVLIAIILATTLYLREVTGVLKISNARAKRLLDFLPIPLVVAFAVLVILVFTQETF